MSEARWAVIGAAADQYGADAMLCYVAAHLRDVDARPFVVLPEDGPLQQRLTADHLPVTTVDTLVVRKRLRDPRLMARELLAVPARAVAHARLLRGGPRNVYVNTVTVPLWAVVGFLLRRKVVVHVHEIVGSATAVVRVARWLLYLQLFLADKVICVSAAVREDVLEAHPALAERCVTLLNANFRGQETEKTQPGPPSAAVVADFVVVGRLSPRKGQHLVLDALRCLDPGSRPSVAFVGTAYPGYEWYHDGLVQRIQDERLPVRLLGYLPTDQAFRCGRSAIVPSTVPDPAPLVVLESLARGKIVIAARVGGIPELLGPAGLAFDANHAEQLASCMAEVGRLSEAERGRLEAVSRDRAEELSAERYWQDFDLVVLEHGR